MTSTYRSRLHLAILSSTVLPALACSPSDGEPAATPNRCAEIVNALKSCYPDLEAEGRCTPETLSAFENYDMGTLSCEALDDMGKADVFAFGGCGEGEHVCGFVFCCADYTITRDPTATDWDLVELVDEFQLELPADVEAERLALSANDLEAGVAWTWEQDIVATVGAAPKPMAVELSERVISLPYDDFIARMPPQEWGIHLQYYVGGEVQVVETDSAGRATEQSERMVLSPFPCDMDTRLGNNDMTKAELIEYDDRGAKVRWRVYYSNNDSTEADVGSVEFRAQDAGTRVTFFSAHRLNAPLGIHISTSIVQVVLQTYFLDHIEAYRRYVSK